jgi:hypothetical protein
MYACIPEIGGGFFQGVRRLEDRSLTFRDPPLLPWHSRIDSGRHTLVANRTGSIQVCGYGLSRMYLPRRLVNKPWSMHRTATGGIMLMGSTR